MLALRGSLRVTAVRNTVRLLTSTASRVQVGVGNDEQAATPATHIGRSTERAPAAQATADFKASALRLKVLARECANDMKKPEGIMLRDAVAQLCSMRTLRHPVSGVQRALLSLLVPIVCTHTPR